MVSRPKLIFTDFCQLTFIWMCVFLMYNRFYLSLFRLFYLEISRVQSLEICRLCTLEISREYTLEISSRRNKLLFQSEYLSNTFFVKTHVLNMKNAPSKKVFIILCSVRDHPYNTSDKGVGGFKKWYFWLTFSTVFMLTYWVGGSEKVQK